MNNMGIKKINQNKAQSTLEFALVVTCFAAALLAMSVYLSRAFQGKFREVADSVGSQYSATDVVAVYNTTYSSDVTTRLEPKKSNDGKQVTITTTETLETQNEKGTEALWSSEKLFP